VLLASVVGIALIVGAMAVVTGVPAGPLWFRVCVVVVAAALVLSFVTSIRRDDLRAYLAGDAGDPGVPQTEADGERSGSAGFERLVAQALDALPPEIAAQMSNVAVVVEDEPCEEKRILGLYHGIPLTYRNRWYAGVLPDTITIYRGPLERMCAGKPELLADEVRHTVFHEVAHHFGISDERLLEIDRY